MKEGIDRADRVHDYILSAHDRGRDRYFDELRLLCIPPSPDELAGSLYAPNPVVLPRKAVARMTTDMNVFTALRQRQVPRGEDLVATMAPSLRETFAGLEVAARLVEDLRRSPPFVCLDAYMVEVEGGLDPAYLEWQTIPSYPASALDVLACWARALPAIEDLGGGFSPIAGESLDELSERVRRTLVGDFEEDPRQVVLIDFEPENQFTGYEFRLQQRLTGGRERGFGVIDPREIRYLDGRPTYERDGEMIPIGAVYTRLVHDDMERLLSVMNVEERETLGRFFKDVEQVVWRVHPLHFLYGSKRDFPSFVEAKASEFLPSCRIVDEAMLEDLRRRGVERLEGLVQKPIEGCGGRGVIADPSVEELERGALLQERIEAAAFHPTKAGPRTPEIRIMGLPGDDGELYCCGVFTRVKAPDEFRSNASAIAEKAISGTGEGYAIFVD